MVKYLLVFVAGVGSLALVQNPGLVQNLAQYIPNQNKVESKIPPQTLAGEIQSIGKLLTADYLIKIVISTTQGNSVIGIQIGQTDLLTQYEGKVSAGVDLSKSVPQVVETQDKIQVTGLKSEVLVIDAGRPKLVKLDKSYIAPDGSEQMTESYDQAKQTILDESCKVREDGTYLMKTAAENSKVQLERILNAATNSIKTIVVDVEVGDCVLPVAEGVGTDARN
jgi:hypothetical protein